MLQPRTLSQPQLLTRGAVDWGCDGHRSQEFIPKRVSRKGDPSDI